jgi:hypothetical protein
MSILFFKVETKQELLRASSIEYFRSFANFKITKTVKFLNFVIYQKTTYSI